MKKLYLIKPKDAESYKWEHHYLNKKTVHFTEEKNHGIISITEAWNLIFTQDFLKGCEI